MERKAHWENIYATKSHREVSWFTEHDEYSLDLVRKTRLPPDAAILEVGGGASTWVDDLASEGFRDLTVLDISAQALAISRARLGEKAGSIRWIEADLLQADFAGRRFDLWHDRAVFHFLRDETDREAYRAQVESHVKPGGFLVLSIFAADGPLKCSLLDTRRHTSADLVDFFGANYALVHASESVHRTPSGSPQNFVHVILKKSELPVTGKV